MIGWPNSTWRFSYTVLGTVSHGWRAITWAIPTLWTKLVVNVLSKGHAHAPELVKEWLERSSELPVDVALCHPVDLALRTDEVESPIVLEGQQKADAESVVDVLNQSWSKLRSLDLRDIPWSLSTKLSSDTPSALVHLCVGGYPNEDIASIDRVPLFRQTTHKHRPMSLSIPSPVPPARIVFDAITLCASSLTNITLKAIHDDNDDMDIDANWLPFRVIDLPAFIAISFMELDSQEGFAQILFDHITAPALRSIRYYGMEPTNDIPIDSMISFIQRSSCNIVHLLIHDPSIMFSNPDVGPDDAGAALLPLLHAMPGLRVLELSLDFEVSIESLFLLLANRVPRPDLPTFFLPQLKRFQCSVYPPFDWMLLPDIYIPTSRNRTQIGDPDFKFSEMGIGWARQKLSVDLTLRDESQQLVDEDDYVSKQVLMALMAIKPQIRGEIRVRAEMEEDSGSAGRKGERGSDNFLEKSFLYRFPVHIRPEYLMMYQGAKMMGLF